MYKIENPVHVVHEPNWKEFDKQFCLGIRSVQQLQSGNMKYTYVINSDNGMYIAQKYKFGDYLLKKLPFIVAFTAELNNLSDYLMYPEYICTNSGAWLVDGFSLQRFIANDDVQGDLIMVAKECAKALRRFHDECESLGNFEHQDLLAIRNLRVSEKWFTKAELYRVGIIHGEFRLRNLLFEKGHPKAVIDFDSVCYGLRCIDIAYLMLDFVERDTKHLEDIVKGIHRAYDDSIPIEAGFSSLGLLVDDYIKKCSSGYLTNNRALSVAQYKELLQRIIVRCN